MYDWKRALVLCVTSLVLSLVAGTAHALSTDAQQPINIRARQVDANEKTGVSVYRGNVVLTQGSLRLQADRLEVMLRAGRTDTIRAWGDPVRLRTQTDQGEELQARAKRVVYRTNARRIELHDAVELSRDGDVFTGAVLHYALDEQTFRAEGDKDEQLSVVIQPPKAKKTP